MSEVNPHPIVQRPALAQWVWERNLTWHQAGELFGCSHEHARRICLPFDDPNRRVPVDPLMTAICTLTGLTPADFYPPRLPAGQARARPITPDEARG